MPGIEDFLRATLRYADLLHTLALRLTPHPADTADIVQGDLPARLSRLAPAAIR